MPSFATVKALKRSLGSSVSHSFFVRGTLLLRKSTASLNGMGGISVSAAFMLWGFSSSA